MSAPIGVTYVGVCPASPPLRLAMVMFQGQWLVNATAAPSGVELWQPMQRTCPSAAPFSARLSLGSRRALWPLPSWGERDDYAVVTGLNP